MIGAVISGRLFKATSQMFNEAKLSSDQREKIRSFDVFDVRRAPSAAVEFDLSSTAAMPVASALGQPVGPVASELARLTIEQEPREPFTRLIDNVVATDLGYINFHISNSGLREWVLLVLSTAKSLESRDFGRIVRAIKEIRMPEAPPPEQLEKIAACSRRCVNLLKSLKATRFDIEQGNELPPLIETPNESAFLRAYLEGMNGVPADPEHESEAKQPVTLIDRDVIIRIGLLVDDLLKAGVTKNNEPFAAANISRICRYAYDLASAVDNSLDESSIVSPDSGITALRLCLVIAAARLLSFVESLAEFAAGKFAGTPR